MVMKATLGMNYRMLSSNLEDMSARLYELRQQSATGKKMNKPSDDPGSIRPLLNNRLKLLSAERYTKHTGNAKGEMQVLDSNLDQVENIMVSAKETAVAANNGAVNQADRETYADRVGQLFEELLQMANTSNSGKYVYSGYREDTVPFTVNQDYDPGAYDPGDSSTWAVSYNGDADAKTLEIAPGKRIQTSLPGCGLFLGDSGNNGVVDEGNTDLFSTLKNLESAIRKGEKAEIDEGLEKLAEGADQVRRLRGRMGNNAWRVERAERYMEDASLEFQEVISKYEDADVVEVFSELVQHETAFKAALNVTTRVSRLSILDYM